MNISKLFTRKGQPFAVLLKDGTEEYAVFLESLVNTVYCDELISHGWNLCGLPYDFRKNGQKLADLPTQEWAPSPDKEQEMWDMIGDPLSQDELRARITESPDLFIPFEKGNYTILTREDLIAYLTAIESTELLEDFLPLNYFVHPAALFDYEEYMDVANSHYVSIINNRRTMSLPKFNKLIEWCFTQGLKKDFAPLDLVEFYFSWGVCGLDLPIISKYKETRHIVLGAPTVTPDQVEMVTVKNKEIGLINKYGEYSVPASAKNNRWVPRDSETVITEVRRSLGVDQLAVVELTRKAVAEVIVMETLKCTMQYDANRLLIGNTKFSTLSVRSFEGNGAYVHNKFWNPSTEEDRNNDMFLKALASHLIDKLTLKVDVSSYKALLESGCSPLSALQKIQISASMDKMDAINKEEATPIDFSDLQKYLGDSFLPDDKIDVIESILSGDTNIDKTSLGYRADLNADPSIYYQAFYAANNILSIPAADIYRQVSEVADDTKELVFGSGDKKLTVPLRHIDNKYRSYLADKQVYKQQQAKQCNEIIYVTSVARELGSEKAKRHVALSMYCVARSKPVEALLEKLKDEFIEEVRDNIVGERYQNMYMDSAMVWACTAFFDLGLKGSAKFPDKMGGRKIEIDSAGKSEYLRHMESSIEDTVSMCDTAILYDGSFRRFVVNAVVTPEAVVPRKGYNILETAFAAVWRDYSSMPQIKTQLEAKGLIPKNFKCWDMQFFNNSLCEHELGTTGMDLYYTRSEEERRLYPKDKEYISATHPLYYKYPKLEQEEQVETIDPPRAGAPAFKIGEARFMSAENTEQFESAASLQRKEVVGFKEFYGLTAEDFYFTGGSITYPSTSREKKNITILSNESFFTEETGVRNYAEVASLSDTQYPISTIRGRKMLLCDSAGKLWEVTV